MVKNKVALASIKKNYHKNPRQIFRMQERPSLSAQKGITLLVPETVNAVSVHTKEVLLITLVVVALIGAVNWNGVSGAAVTTTEAATSPAWMIALIAGLAAVTLIMYFFKSE